MELMLSYTFACLVVPVFGSLMCSPQELFGPLQMNTSIVNAAFETVYHLGLLQCVRSCYVKGRCKSFNYVAETGTCHLNSKTENEVTATDRVNIANTMYSNIADWSGKLAGACNNHTCPLDSVCVDRNDTVTCEIVYCRVPTNLTNGVVLQEGTSFYNHGEDLGFSCKTGYRAQGKMVCGTAGAWESTAVCIPPPVSCKDVKECNQSYGDGEYWLRYNSTSNFAVKIYCYQMGSGDILEFITLPEDNFSLFPTTCQTSHCGRTSFTKVKVWSKKRAARKQDFSSGGCGETAPFGLAGSCSGVDDCQNTQDRAPQYFKINTTGTGFIVDPNLSWQVEVGNVTVTRSHDDQVVQGTCFSTCGQCYPNFWYAQIHRVVFIPHLDTQPPESTATVPICPSYD